MTKSILRVTMCGDKSCQVIDVATVEKLKKKKNRKKSITIKMENV